MPAQRLAALVDLTRGIGMLAEPVDEFDTVIAPGARVDARAGLAQTIARRPEYAADETGPYIVQFHGPLLKQWLEAIRSANFVPARYLPHNAYIVAATPADFATIPEFSFIQWSDLYHPALKPLDVSTSSFQPDEVIVDLINQPGVAKTIALLRSVAPFRRCHAWIGSVFVRTVAMEQSKGG